MATSTSNPDKETDDAFLTEAPVADISFISFNCRQTVLFSHSDSGQSQSQSLSETEPTKMSNWTVSYNEDQGAMQILYDITNLFLKPIIKPKLFPPEIMDQDIQTWEDLRIYLTDFWPEILRQNIPMIVSVAFGFLFSLLR